MSGDSSILDKFNHFIYRFSNRSDMNEWDEKRYGSVVVALGAGRDKARSWGRTASCGYAIPVALIGCIQVIIAFALIQIAKLANSLSSEKKFKATISALSDAYSTGILFITNSLREICTGGKDSIRLHNDIEEDRLERESHEQDDPRLELVIGELGTIQE